MEVIMATRNNIIGVLLAAFLTTPALAIPPETVTNYCAKRAQDAPATVNTSIPYRVGFVDGFLDAVLDSLRKDGYVCPPIDAQQFCNLYSVSKFLGGGAFDRARDALLHVCQVVG
jgi:hypothetical protein